MGKGNQFIKDRDGNGVRTFYFDPYGDFEEEKKAVIKEEREELAEELSGLPFAERRRKVEQMMMEGRFPVRVNDDRIWNRIGDYADDEIDNLGYEIGGIPGFTRREKREFEGEIVAGYRDSGFVIAESDNCQVVIADNESCVAIGCIPVPSRDNIEDNVREDEGDAIHDEAEAELEKTRKRADANYEITYEDVRKLADEKIRARVENLVAERDAKFKADANAVMRKVHEYFGTQSISVRSCAWTSSGLKPYDELTEEERNGYY